MNGSTTVDKDSAVRVVPFEADRSLAVVAIPVDTYYVAIARTTALHVATRLGLSVRQATDLRLAVDEACALFIEQHGPESGSADAAELAGPVTGLDAAGFGTVPGGGITTASPGSSRCC